MNVLLSSVIGNDPSDRKTSFFEQSTTDDKNGYPNKDCSKVVQSKLRNPSTPGAPMNVMLITMLVRDVGMNGRRRRSETQLHCAWVRGLQSRGSRMTRDWSERWEARPSALHSSNPKGKDKDERGSAHDDAQDLPGYSLANPNG